MFKRKLFFIVFLMFLVVLIAGCDNQVLKDNQVSDEKETVVSQKIAYELYDGQKYFIYNMGTDGDSQTNLTKDLGHRSDDLPVSSPDGTKIAFVGNIENEDTASSIFIMNADGSNISRLTDDTGDDINTAWSPDGTKIAFLSTRLSGNFGNYDLFVIDANGNNLINITNSHNVNDISYPDWSPDGNELVFVHSDETYPYHINNICVANSDGSGVITYLTEANDTNKANNLDPDWSPDGTKIVYHSNKATNYDQLWVIDMENKTDTQFTTDARDSFSPVWSPDGSKIAYLSFWGTIDDDIYIINTDGTSPTNITDDDYDYGNPFWSPDGTKLICESSRNGNTNIFIMDVDGNNQVQLTNSNHGAYNPCWIKTLE